MSDAQRRIVAMGGGGFSMNAENLALERWLLSLVDRDCPRVCFIPTASGDADGYIRKFYATHSRLDCEPSHLSLFRRQIDDIRTRLLAQDIIYVGGGNTVNMLAVWRAHGLDTILCEAWERGIVLTGLSAGSLCWYESGVTDSMGTTLGPLEDGLGLLPGSHCPHYDGEEQRRPTYRCLVQDGELPPGVAADDGVALLYEGTDLVEVVTARAGGAAWRVERGDRGAAEERIDARQLPEEESYQPFRGGCHCGRVVWEIDVDPRMETVLDCNCSICRDKGFLHLIVAPEDFRLLQGEDDLREYRFNTGTAVHKFCATCGIHSFYVPRSHPDKIDVNARCIDGVDIAELTVERFDGTDWEENVAEIQ